MCVSVSALLADSVCLIVVLLLLRLLLVIINNIIEAWLSVLCGCAESGSCLYCVSWEDSVIDG